MNQDHTVVPAVGNPKGKDNGSGDTTKANGGDKGNDNGHDKASSSGHDHDH